MKTFVVLLALCLSVRADDIIPMLKVGDASYTNATLRKVSPTSVIVRHDGGFGSAAITNLPQSLRAQFLDQSEIEAEKKKVDGFNEAAAKRREEADRAARRANFVVIEGRYIPKKSLRSVSFEIDQVRADGARGRTFLYKDIRRYGPGIASTGIRVGSELRYGHEVFVRNLKGGSVGKKVGADAMKLGTTNIAGVVVELWDCGKTPD